jgi:DNA-binding protein H-NS
MPKSLAQVNAQIAKLQREADTIKAKEATTVIKRIRQAIDRYGLTASDLGLRATRSTRARPLQTPAPSKKRATRRQAQPAGVIKYRDDAGNGWTGRGRPPFWFTAAIESGKTREELAVR